MIVELNIVLIPSADMNKGKITEFKCIEKNCDNNAYRFSEYCTKHTTTDSIKTEYCSTLKCTNPGCSDSKLCIQCTVTKDD